MALDPQNVGPIVKSWRAKLGLSRENFAQRVGLTPGALWRVENKNSLKPGEYDKLAALFDTEDHGALPILPATTMPKINVPRGTANFTIIDPIPTVPPTVDTPELTLTGVTESAPMPARPLVELPVLPGLLTTSPTEMSANDGYRRISNSEVQTWKRCRRKWWFAYHRRLQPKHENPTGARSIGTTLHEALRYHYVGPAAPKVNVQDALEAIIARNYYDLRTYHESVDGDLIPLSVDTQFKADADLMRIIVEGYIQWLAETGSDAEFEVTGSEVYLEADLDLIDNVKIIGRLDARVRRVSDGMRLFIDHKSVGNFQQLTRVLHLNEQMLWYILLESLQEDPAPIAGALYNMMRRVKRSANAKPPFYDRVEVHHNKYELESFHMRLTGVILDILDAETRLSEGVDHRGVVYPTPTKDCPWDCPFFQVCSMTDDGSHVEGMIKSFFIEGDPLRYYTDPASLPG